MEYKNPEFYVDYRKKIKVLEVYQISQLKGFEMLKDYYELHYFEDEFCAVYNNVTGQYKRPNRGTKNSPYFLYWFRGKEKEKIGFSLHRLVCSAFHENIENKPMVNHIDSDTYNNKPKNLEWCTARENILHAISLGHQIGRAPKEKKPKVYKTVLERSKIYSKGLTFDDVTLIFKKNKEGENQSEIARFFGVSSACINQIICGKRWTNHPCSGARP